MRVCLFLVGLAFIFTLPVAAQPLPSGSVVFHTDKVMGFQDTTKKSDGTKKSQSEGGDEEEDEEEKSDTRNKSRFLAALYSFALPGMGELYAGNFSSGRYWLGVDVSLLLGGSIMGFRAQSLENDYQTLARSNAGVSGEQSAQFWLDISSFRSINEFNEERLRRRDLAGLYDPARNFWDWNTDENRRLYRETRIASDGAYQSIFYFGAAMLLNRLFSMINAVRGVNHYNRALQPAAQSPDISLRISPQYNFPTALLPDGIAFKFQRSF
jgi:hypothetical protein